ncbi:MAG: D-aminoacyl-tRNA deacylase [Candidatus Dormibacteria bacterium]
MRAVIQRVKHASVSVENKTIGTIDAGLLILLGIGHDDTSETASHLASRIVTLRIFPDDEGKMNRSLLDCGREALVISQFTLFADTHKGHRPSFLHAARPEHSIPLYEEFVRALSARGVHTATGSFGAHMEVSLINDGPVTIVLSHNERPWDADAG